ncbi:MAG: ABC transporter permease subunit [Spirochaetes bacterium]|nr:ABC transporter permease subunit [Spirochaetota bacterium]
MTLVGAKRSFVRARAAHAAVMAAAAVLALPVGVIVASVVVPASEGMLRLWQTVLPGYLINTAVVAVAVPVAAAVIGTALAWITTRYEFPARRILTAAAAAPLAVPSYIAAYAYAGLLDYTGPLQAALGRVGLASDSLYLLPIASLPGLVFILSLVLYPYVFLTTRAAFAARSERLVEAARSLGVRHGLFFRLGLPVARPAVAAGMLLILMESLAAYGAPFYLGVDTLTTGVFRSWFSAGSVITALKLASMLLLMVVLAVGAERAGRGRAGYAGGAGMAEQPPRRRRLSGAAAGGVMALVALPPVLGFVLPVFMLVRWALSSLSAVSAAEGHELADTLQAAAGTLSSSGGAAVVTVALALFLSWSTRSGGTAGRHLRAAVSVAASGYAVPGAVIAVGVLAVATRLDRAIEPVFTLITGTDPRGILMGSFALLLYAYAVRYLAVAYRPLAAGFDGIGVPLERAARSLGHGPVSTLARVHVPMGRASLAAAFMLVFVDVSKELPLTLVLRPFNFETLAVRAFALANDERLLQAGFPSLVLVAIGLAGMVAAWRILSTSGKEL